METPEPTASRSARQFVMTGVQLQESLKNGKALDATLDAFCREAFARKDLAQSISFLLSLVQKDVTRLAQILQVRHLVAELSVGSQILSSLVAAQWDKSEQTDRLAELAEGILSARRAGTDMSTAGEFSAALAKTIAVMHPGHAKALLEMAAPSLAGPEHASMLKEAWDWQKAGELLSGKDMEFRKFWHQTLRQQRGDWFWDTAEGRKALSGLDSGKEDLNVRGGLFRRAVPSWAWQSGDTRAEPPMASEAPSRNAPPEIAAPPPVPLAAEDVKAARPSSSWAIGGSLALLACAAIVVAATQVDFANLLTAPATAPATLATATPTTPTIVKPAAPATITPAIATVTPAAPPAGQQPPAALSLAPAEETSVPNKAASPTTASVSAPSSPATIPPTPAVVAEPAAPPKPVAAAQLVPVQLASRKGWVKTPLNTEFQVTPANAVDGKVTDAEGRHWQLPEDPKLVAEMKSPSQVVNPYDGQTVTLSAAESQPGHAIAYGKTGWTFRLPATLPVEMAAAKPSDLEPETPTSPGKPGATAGPEPKVAPLMAASTPTATASTIPSPVQPLPTETIAKASPSSAPVIAGKPVTEVVKRPAGLPSATTSKKAKTVASKKKTASSGKMVTSRRPTGTAQRNELEAANDASRQQLVFVTRANSIRMNYKGGYWESRPGAYLNGAGETPSEWARDMTLRERSSGTIPQGYMFKVMDHGVVRVLPEPPGR